MIGRPIFVILLLCAACGGPGTPGDQPTGRIVLERTAPPEGRLAEIPASASWCASDTTLSIVGTDGSWSAAIALRVSWPRHRPLMADVDSLPAAGRASIAVRQLRDSVATALVARRGKVMLALADSTLEGHFEFSAGSDSTATSLSGSFEGLAVVSTCR